MSSFKEANQVKNSLKMTLSNYAWFKSLSINLDDDGYHVVVHVNKIDNSIRKVIAPVQNGVSVKTEVSG